MSTEQLTPVSYVVLGLVASGASTSYELKQKVANSVGYMWTFPHSALYAEPGRLVRMGLLEEQREASGRRRRLYTITDDGRRALVEWLRLPTFDPAQLRDLGLLKLFFGGLVSSEEVVALARAQEEAHGRRLVAYETLDSRIPTDGSMTFPRATLEMGLKVERAFVAFWHEIGDHPPRG